MVTGMGNCPKCGLSLYKGNIKVIRKNGKRPRREHRTCPPKGRANGTADAIHIQRPQVAKDGPPKVAIVLGYNDPNRYRYYMTEDQAERVKNSLGKIVAGFGVAFEVIPIPDYQVDQNPEAFANLVEVKVEWKT